MLLENMIAGKRKRAALALGWERLWPRLAPIGLLICLFLALAFLGLPAALPGWLHSVGLALFAAAVGYFAWRLRQLDFRPGPGEIDQRLERDSGLAHQPLRSLADPLSGGRTSALTQALWRSHQRRLRAQLHDLKVALPRPNFADHDKYLIRGTIFLLLVIGLFIGGHDWRTRLARAFTPGFESQTPVVLQLDAWINPPDYTNVAPYALASDGSMASIKFPEGSEILARLNDAGRLASLLLDGKKVASFKTTNGSDQEVSHKIKGGASLSVNMGKRRLYHWALKVIVDQAPTAAFKKPPLPTARGVLRLTYEAADDYGLTGITLRIEKAAANRNNAAQSTGRKTGSKKSKTKISGGQSLAREKLDVELSGELIDDGGTVKKITNTLFRDFTPHPWAGEKVLLTLVARDAKGQIGKSKSFAMTLPERPFRHPVARAIIEQRKNLIRRPAHYGPVHDTLRAIAATPNMYENHLQTRLGLEFAASRLNIWGEKAIPSLLDLLWDIALGIEDGKLSLAERSLRAAQEALMKALARDAGQAEIDRLMKELRRAMDNYLTALTQNALARMQKQQMTPQQQRQAQLVDRDELQRMLDQIQRLARAGSKQAARDLLKQLQNMMENLKANPRLARPGQMSPEQQAVRELQRLMQQQRNLQDRTFQNSARSMQRNGRGRSRQGQVQRGRGQRGEGQMGALDSLARQQESLRRQLGDLMRRYGERAGRIPDPLGKAERSMRDARELLGQGRAGGALDMQSQAQQQLAQGLRRMLQNQSGKQQAGDSEGLDDYGRDGPNSRSRSDLGDGNGRQNLPTRMDLQRALEILKELHKRSGDRGRPKYELDYFERLLRRF